MSSSPSKENWPRWARRARQSPASWGQAKTVGVVLVVALTLIGAAVIEGEVGGLSGIAAVFIATGILIAMVFGVALVKTEAEIMGE